MNAIDEEPTVPGTVVEDNDGDRYRLEPSDLYPGASWVGISEGLEGDRWMWRTMRAYGPLKLITDPTPVDKLAEARKELQQVRSSLSRGAYVRLARALEVEPTEQMARITLEIPVTDFDTGGDTRSNLQEYFNEQGVPDFITEGIRSVQVGSPGLFS